MSNYKEALIERANSLIGSGEVDMVNHPPHYNQYGEDYETIKIILYMVEGLTPEQAVFTHNIVKYLVRFPYKDGWKDIAKARWNLREVFKLREVKEDEGC